jgi:hypothetical protein
VSTAGPQARPPRPRLTIRVGITGHRWDKLSPTHVRELFEQLRGVLLQVAGLAQRIRDDPESGFRGRFTRPNESPPLPPELRLVSALAEGADRLLVEAAPEGWRLQAILPFPVEVYQQDFTEPDSRQTLERYVARARSEAGVLILDGDRQAPNAFEPVGTAICLNSDVLVAVWDGKPGRAGGTGFVVALAEELGIPIVRVAPDASRAPWLHPSATGLEGLEERLRSLVSAPVPSSLSHEDPEVPDLREEYFAERQRKGRRGQLYGFMLRVLGYRWKGLRQLIDDLLHPGLPYRHAFPRNYPEAIRIRWRERWEKRLGLPPELVEQILATRLPDHYGWASYLANYYAGLYRSAFLWAYSLSTAAVACAAVGLVQHLLGRRDTWSVLGWAGGELVLLLLILILVTRARIGEYRERWLAYRSLTERLRSLTYTLPLARVSTLRAETGPPEARTESWIDWMHRAVVREVSILSVNMTPAHLEVARRMLVEGELAEQVRYHENNADRLMRVEHRLSGVANATFFLGLLIALIEFKDGILEGLHHEVEPGERPGMTILGVIGLTMPAAAAAMHGFLSQAEFKDTAIRSRGTRRHLLHLLELGRAPDAARSSAALGGLAAASAAAMDAELGAWFAAYQGKDVPLP